MTEDNFLDTNVIFHYSNYNDFSGKLLKNCYLFIKNKKGRFILCWSVIVELQKIIEKRIRVHKAVIEKIKDTSYTFENSNLLSFRDIPDAKKLYEKFKDKSIKDAKEIFDSQRRSSEIKIEQFINAKVDEKVIPLDQVDIILVKRIHDYIDNYADCKILASALQFQKDQDIFTFVTADQKDINPNYYSFLKDQFGINYPKDNYKFPELKNLLYE